MTEISLNVLDIAQNCISANATLVEIELSVDTAIDALEIVISDNGHGMTPEQLKRVEDPFYTSRTTRKVGLGVPLFKMSAQMTGGSFSIDSESNKGTRVRASFGISHIDRMPLGDINSTIHALVTLNPDIDFVYCYKVNGKEFTLDTRKFREILQGVPLNSAEVSSYIREFLEQNKQEVDKGLEI